MEVYSLKREDDSGDQQEEQREDLKN